EDDVRALQLQAVFRRLPTSATTAVSSWAGFGAPLWLVTVNRSSSRSSQVIVVRADSVLADVSASDAARVWLRQGVSLVADAEGEPFGAPFAGVAVRYSAASVAGVGSLQRLFYVAAIA